MIKFKKKNDIKRIDITLRNFLAYLLYKKDEYVNKLSKEYSINERSEFLYNCARNTFIEYIYTHKRSTFPRLASMEIEKLFKENFLLRQFHNEEYDTSNISESTKKILKEFECIKKPLTGKEKNIVIEKVDNILASAA